MMLESVLIILAYDAKREKTSENIVIESTEKGVIRNKNLWKRLKKEYYE